MLFIPYLVIQEPNSEEEQTRPGPQLHDVLQRGVEPLGVDAHVVGDLSHRVALSGSVGQSKGFSTQRKLTY